MAIYPMYDMGMYPIYDGYIWLYILCQVQRCALRHGMEPWWMTLAYGPKWWDILMRAPSHPESKGAAPPIPKGFPKTIAPKFRVLAGNTCCW